MDSQSDTLGYKENECIMNFDPVYSNVIIRYSEKGLINYIEVFNGVSVF